MTKYADLFTALAAPFDDWEVRTRKDDSPGGARELAYVDASTVANRLDDVLGPENWSDETVHYGECALCTLSITLPGGEVVRRSGIGGYIHTSTAAKLRDASNLAAYRAKAAASDAFKRAAAKLGVGRYLGKSGVPIFARGAFGPPPGKPAPAPPPAPPSQARPDRTRPADMPKAPPATEAPPPPVDTRKASLRFLDWAKAEGRSRGVDLVHYLNGWGRGKGYPSRLGDWSDAQVKAGFAEASRKLATVGDTREPELAGAGASANGNGRH